jgi:hypothetical protein
MSSSHRTEHFSPIIWNVNERDLENYMLKNSGRRIRKLQFSKLLAMVWTNAAVAGCISTGRYSFNPDILP